MDSKSRKFRRSGALALAAAILSIGAIPSVAQVPVDAEGKALGGSTELGTSDGAGAAYEEAGTLGPAELAELVGPVALYPDDLLAIVLPASAYPLEIVQAARFLERFEKDSSLKPSEEWDESVTALLNYPEVLRMMDKDIDWTWNLGDAFVNQQADVIAAVEAFRDRAYAAGNLKSDKYQTVNNEDGIIEIVPVNDEIIYVPYYEPQRVVVRQVAPVYYYYPRPYPVYYYPYPLGYSFYDGYFWGVTTAYRIAWSSHHLHVHHHSYWGHPYYGRSYYGHYYRRPSVHIYNNWYVYNSRHYSANRYRDGDYWRPRHHAGDRPDYYRSRTRSYRDRDVRAGNEVRDSYTTQATTNRTRQSSGGNARAGLGSESRPEARQSRGDAIRFRDRPESRADSRSETRPGSATDARSNTRSERREPLRSESRQESRGETRGNRPAVQSSSGDGRSPAATANRERSVNRETDSRIVFRDRSSEPQRNLRGAGANTLDARTREPAARPAPATAGRDVRAYSPAAPRSDSRADVRQAPVYRSPPSATRSEPRSEARSQARSESRPARTESPRAERQEPVRNESPRAGRESHSDNRRSQSSAHDRSTSQRSRNR